MKMTTSAYFTRAANLQRLHDGPLGPYIDLYASRLRGLVRGTIVRHLPAVRRFLQEAGVETTGDFAKLDQAVVIGFVERHARDRSPATARNMCWALRAFLRYLRWEGWTLVDLAGSGFCQVSRQPTRCSGSSLSMECQPLWFSRILARDLTEPKIWRLGVSKTRSTNACCPPVKITQKPNMSRFKKMCTKIDTSWLLFFGL